MNTLTSQHDLAFDTAHVSFPRLLKTVQIAVGYAKVACENCLSDIQTASLKSDHRELMFATRALAENATALEQAADTLHILMESQCRNNFVIKDKPPICNPIPPI